MMKIKLTIVVFVLIITSGCSTRGLLQGEIEKLDKEYSGKVNYEKVKVADKSVEQNEMYMAVKNEYLKKYPQAKDKNIEFRPFVINNTIYYPRDKYKDDFSRDYPNDAGIWATFVHENCHILAYQLGLRSDKHGGNKYTWIYGLKEQLTIKDPYKTPWPNEIKSTDELDDFRFEQQCVIFERWALYRHADSYKPYGKLIKDALKKNIRLNTFTNFKMENNTLKFNFNGEFDDLVDIITESSRISLGTTDECRASRYATITKKDIDIDKGVLNLKANARLCGLIDVGDVKSKIKLKRKNDSNYLLTVKIRAPVDPGLNDWWDFICNPYERKDVREKQLLQTTITCLKGNCIP